MQIVSVIFFALLLGEKVSTQAIKTKNRTIPKHWFAYVEKLIASTIQDYKMIFKNKNWMLHSSHRAKFIHHHLGKIDNIGEYSNYVHYTLDKKFYIRFILKYPIGKLDILQLGKESYMYCELKGPIKIERLDKLYRWHLNLDILLRIELYFEYIYINLLNIRGCYAGQVSVKSIFINTESLIASFCGVQSYMVVFPPTNKVNVELSVKKYVISQVLLSYSVMDPKLVISCSTDKITDNIRPDWIVYNTKTMVYTEKYYLTVEKWKQIQVTVHIADQNAVSIYYGYFPKHSKLKFHKKLQNSTQIATLSFQCLIIVNITSQSKGVISLNYVENLKKCFNCFYKKLNIYKYFLSY